VCVVSGRGLTIAPNRAPLDLFRSYEAASHRVFMSATLTDDSFLTKGLGLGAEAITRPVVYPESKWAGEKMVLIPQLIHEGLDRAEIVAMFAKPSPNRKFGIVSLVPSGEAAKSWSAMGATVATKDDIDGRIRDIRSTKPGNRDKALVVVNRYDGIDLPDSSCRILVIDGKPFGDALLDRFVEGMRPGSAIIMSKVARVIEQGMGRAVRGEKDYCVIVLTGADLIKTVRSSESRSYLSEQTRTQVEIGLEVASYTKEDLAKGKNPADVLRGVINQCLGRDEGWKAFYEQRMAAMLQHAPTHGEIAIYEAELEAERLSEGGRTAAAIARLQRLLDDSSNLQEVDRGWYLQEMARYAYRTDKAKSSTLQRAAYEKNRLLLRPPEGVATKKLAPLPEGRIARILSWTRAFNSNQELIVAVDDILGGLRFGVRAESFEQSLAQLGQALGFASERPDKEWKSGPDNLWAVKEGEYILFECKSEVESTRAEISRSETGQMSNSIAWFSQEYRGAECTNVLIIPAKTLSKGAGFTDDVLLLRQQGLSMLVRHVRAFFVSLAAIDLRDIREESVQTMLDANELSVRDLRNNYYEAIRAQR
jgi:hypothetical protein